MCRLWQREESELTGGLVKLKHMTAAEHVDDV